MPECRGCGVALAPHELQLCRECWEATEDDDGLEDAYGYSRSDLLFGGNW
jgi:hypothetical protein